jgi:hypothetical protein
MDRAGDESLRLDCRAIGEAYSGRPATGNTDLAYSALVSTLPPPAAITRASASGRLADPPTGSALRVSAAIIAGKASPLPGAFSPAPA